MCHFCDIQYTDIPGLPCTRHRVFLAVLICAAKYLNDSSPKNVHWQKYGRFFSLPEVNLMERQLLFLLDYDLSVTEAQVIEQLTPYWNSQSSATSSPSTPTYMPSTPVTAAPLIPSVPVKISPPALPTMASMPSMRTAPIRPGGSFSTQQQLRSHSQSQSQFQIRRPSSMSVPATSPTSITTPDVDMVPSTHRPGMNNTPGLMERKASNDSLASTVSCASVKTLYPGQEDVEMRGVTILDTTTPFVAPHEIERVIQPIPAIKKSGFFSGLSRASWNPASTRPY